jgi:hypothetical protein
MKALFFVLLAASQAPATEDDAPAKTVAIPARSESGRLQVLAVETTDGVVIDGVLDDFVWRVAPPVSGFVQAEPYEGEPATENTEVQVAFDRKNLYIAAHCYDRDPSGIVVNDIREDFVTGEQDTFEIVLDTFHDRRNGFVFMTIPEGARADQQMANEGREVNASWDAVWFVRTSRSELGWIVEIAIPFSALRFDLERSPLWGINFSRRIRRNNEIDFWSPVPRSYTLNRVSLAGELAGLGESHPGRDFRVKPYVAGATVRSTGGESFAKDGNVGVDVKYGITRALTLDVTVKPDFAQVEADEQQVNLTQFSQFFPEKRDFFLENSGIFYVGDAARNNRVTYLSPQAGPAGFLLAPHRSDRGGCPDTDSRRGTADGKRRRAFHRCSHRSDREDLERAGEQLQRGAREEKRLRQLRYRRHRHVAPVGGCELRL